MTGLRSLLKSNQKESDLSISFGILIIGVVLGIYFDNISLSILYTALFFTLLLLVFKNSKIMEQPTLVMIISLLVIPLVPLLDQNFNMSALEIITFVLGVTIGLAAILISLGQHSADQWTMGMALLFVALNFIAYQLDSTGRLNLFIVWALFILIMALVYFISQKIPEKPLGGNYTGKTGVVLEGLFPQGKVKVDDEIWDAITVNDAIGKGSVVEIIEKDPNGLRLIVKEIKS